MGGRFPALLGALVWLSVPAAAVGQTMVEGKHFDFSPAEYHAAAPPSRGRKRPGAW